MIIGSKTLGTVSYLGGLPAVLEEFCWSWGQLVAYTSEWAQPGLVHWERSKFSDHAPARNALTTRIVGEWLIQLDTDHVFEPDLVARLVHTADKYGVDVLSGFYQMKTSPHVPVLFQWVGPEDAPGLQPLATWPPEVKVLEVGSAGAGCLFVRRGVFERVTTELGEQPFDKIFPYSEDHSFFLRLKRLNIPAYAALNIDYPHLRIGPVTAADLPQNGDLQISELFAVKGFA